jgi:hypothetical protein
VHAVTFAASVITGIPAGALGACELTGLSASIAHSTADMSAIVASIAPARARTVRDMRLSPDL